jgi:hypothetical protein
VVVDIMEVNLVKENDVDDAEYKKHTYDDLSSEFQRVYPSAVRALQLIVIMYNRLTKVEKLSHRVAIAKIYKDHKHLPGFSRRNICRNLPLDNPSVPRRIRPSWPKNSDTEVSEPSKLSNSIHEEGKKQTAATSFEREGRVEENEKNPKSSLTHDTADLDNNSTPSADKAASQQLESRDHLKECVSCKMLSFENFELKKPFQGKAV